MIVVAIIGTILGTVGWAYSKAKRSAAVIKEAAIIKSKIDDAVIRRAIYSHKDHDFYRHRLQE